ncbi:hypothetical protein ACHAXA_007585 [Cyclostephanos tholiformis]|uniref:Uncharacterized protein n=1 Tax=Cyclostephanos tholiformis TaxID=382380 RepID=A0ABD3R1A1_9STRA
MDKDDAGGEFTTNARDLQKAADLQARLSSVADADADADGANVAPEEHTPTTTHKVDDESIVSSVSIDVGTHKYVLVSATPPPSRHSILEGGGGSTRLFVHSVRDAQYHVNVAECLVPQLEGSGYTNIRILGGGRILRDDDDRRIHIYGYSYGFGRADHALAMGVVGTCTRYRDYRVTWQVYIQRNPTSREGVGSAMHVIFIFIFGPVHIFIPLIIHFISLYAKTISRSNDGY